MKFVYREWEKFCQQLTELGVQGISAREVFQLDHDQKYLVLKHDVETNPQKALTLAKIENKYGHKGSYYIQAYLLTKKHMPILKKISELGHEVSYHYDVMDFCKGDIDKAMEEFKKNKSLFEQYGFEIKTVCQHGNPIVNRVGYTSNRDFFRSEKVQAQFGETADIMVDFKNKADTEYDYISDAGMGFKVIFDPINNDITPSEDKNISLKDLSGVIKYMEGKRSIIISTHPHRWTSNAFVSGIKRFVFKVVRAVAKLLCKIPFMKRFMEKHYYLAKKL